MAAPSLDEQLAEAWALVAQLEVVSERLMNAAERVLATTKKDRDD